MRGTLARFTTIVALLAAGAAVGNHGGRQPHDRQVPRAAGGQVATASPDAFVATDATPAPSPRGYVLRNGVKLPAPIEVDCDEFAGTYLTERDRGRVLRLADTTRFGFCLDEAKHPFEELNVDGCPFGYVSNWSARGPLNYPIGFEVGPSGSCVVRNRDYWVTIVGIGAP